MLCCFASLLSHSLCMFFCAWCYFLIISYQISPCFRSPIKRHFLFITTVQMSPEEMTPVRGAEKNVRFCFEEEFLRHKKTPKRGDWSDSSSSRSAGALFFTHILLGFYISSRYQLAQALSNCLHLFPRKLCSLHH